MVRELSKHQCCFLFDCCVVISRLALLSCYSSVKTRIQPVKSYQATCSSSIIVVLVTLNLSLKNYIITTKNLFMPKHIHKIFEQILQFYVLPHGKEHSKHSSIIGNPNGYSSIRVHQSVTKNHHLFAEACYVILFIQTLIFYR